MKFRLCMFFVALLATAISSLRAQDITRPVFVLNQGEEIQLPEDFVARLEGKSLKVALKSMGLAERNLDRELMVSLIQEDGTRVDMKPDSKGELTFNNVTEGLAALVVAGGPLSYAAIPFYAAPKAAEPEATASSKAFEVPVATVDTGLIRSGVESSGTAGVGESTRPLNYFTPTVANRFQVRLRPSGDMVGRVVVPEAGYDRVPGAFQIAFFRNGNLVQQVSTMVDGTFIVPGLTPGVHSLFATGPSGHAAFSFEVVSADAGEQIPAKLSAKTSNGVHYVSTNANALAASDSLIILVVPPTLMPQLRDFVQQAYPGAPGAPGIGAPAAPGFGAPGMGGGAGGGMGGGGLGGGGAGIGGGGGGLIAAAAGAAAIAAAAGNDDSFNPPLASRPQ